METKPTKIVIGPCLFSYLHVLEPKAAPGSTEAKYSVCLLIKKTDTVSLGKLERATAAAKEEGKSKWGGKIPAKLKLPLRDGDNEKDDPVYAGHYFINASCNNRPQVVDRAKNEITDKEQIYSGMYGLASITLFPFDTAGNKGVAVGLNNLLKTADGERLSGGSTAEEDFKDVDLDIIDTDEDLLG